MLSEISQTMKDKLYDLTDRNLKENQNKEKQNRLIDTDNKCVVKRS